ncbi:hypothetical protein Taro_054258, partial [Colocasia esculenta]|nr:hypothetical protein [Colocasia esculenta]
LSILVLYKCILPTWAEFDIGKAPVYWKTMNGLPPMSGEKLMLFYNPAASKLVPKNDFGIAFHGTHIYELLSFLHLFLVNKCSPSDKKLSITYRGL